MLVDEVEITITAGHGGPGKISFGKLFSGPDGGNGGKGGDVYISSTTDLMALGRFTKDRLIKAQDGSPGGRNRSHGKNGADVEITIPVGTTLTEKDTGEILEIDAPDQRLLVCRGGLGGKGNLEFKSGKNVAPDYAQPGLAGESKDYIANLRFIAEYGLIGLPNSGKSSLLNELTQANSRVGDYPFTTLEASLGVINGRIIADIPGLIEGASQGKGLGTKFLKHIEKVRTLLHCIAADSDDVLKDYYTVSREMETFNKSLLDKPKIILLTKVDLVDNKTLNLKVRSLKKLGIKIIPVSIYDWDSFTELRKIFLS